MVVPPIPIFMEADALGKMRDEAGFASLVIGCFGDMCKEARLTPEFSLSLMHDAWESFCWDTQRLDTNMPKESKPDHFKICGFAAYWLRRHSPVITLKEDRVKITRDEVVMEWRKLLDDYSRAFLAFYFGYRICYFIEANSEKGGGALPRPDMDYLKSLCYVMKYKSLSPHAMGMIYRSLFVGSGG